MKVCIIVNQLAGFREFQKQVVKAAEVLTGEGFFELDPRLLSNRIRVWQANIRYFLDESTIINKLIGNGYDIKLRIKAYQTHYQ